MQTDETIIRLLNATIQSHLHLHAGIHSITQLPMPGEGFSGAQLQCFDVVYGPGSGQTEQVSLVVKHASLVERRVLTYLHQQGYGCIPFCHTFKLTTAVRYQ